LKRKVAAVSLMVALLFSATTVAISLSMASANPMEYLPTIVFKSDGTVSPQTEFIREEGNVYTLTGDLVRNYAIVIQCSNIIFNGGGHIINGGYEYSNYYSNIGLSLDSVKHTTLSFLI
jgi:hypothetical protein